MNLANIKHLLEESLCDNGKRTRQDLVEVIDLAVYNLEKIQQQYLLLDRSVVKETR